MTPKEKAKELFDKYFDMKWQSYNKRTSSIKSMTKMAAKQCTLIAVDEIINNNKKIPANVDGLHTNENSNYWQEVKTEIEKL
jgi:vacuolar-type H+-ATPase subunit E/Vma4